MYFNNIKHNLVIIFCILSSINGCNEEKSKLIIENNHTVEKKIKSNEIFFKKNNVKKKELRNEIKENNNTPKEKKK